jgi:hypothetical protein
MTGAAHYEEAEIAQQAAAAIQAARQPGPEATVTEALLDALVHAVLALAAATALTHFAEMPADDSDQWLDIASLRKPPVPPVWRALRGPGGDGAAPVQEG